MTRKAEILFRLPGCASLRSAIGREDPRRPVVCRHSLTAAALSDSNADSCGRGGEGEGEIAQQSCVLTLRGYNTRKRIAKPLSAPGLPEKGNWG